MYNINTLENKKAKCQQRFFLNCDETQLIK